MRLVYAERRNALIENLHDHFGSVMEMTGAEAGMHLSVVLNGISDRELSVRGARENLWLVPLSAFYMGKAARHGFILGFGSTSVQEMPAAVHKLWTLCAQERRVDFQPPEFDLGG
jgi:GntR family transcriptional regulator / MocR family aminotransferase